MDKFWELLKESVIIQAVMACTLLGVISFMYVTCMEVPDVLVAAFSVILGYYFGSKAQVAVNKKVGGDFE